MRKIFRYYFGYDEYEYEADRYELMDQACNEVFYEYFYNANCFDYDHLTFRRKKLISALYNYISDIEGDNRDCLLEILDSFDLTSYDNIDTSDDENLILFIAEVFYDDYFSPRLPAHKMTMTEFVDIIKSSIIDILDNYEDYLFDDTVDFFEDNIKDELYEKAYDEYHYGANVL